MHFDAQPVLTGELVTLRPLGPGDFDELYTVAADPRFVDRVMFLIGPQRTPLLRRVWDNYYSLFNPFKAATL